MAVHSDHNEHCICVGPAEFGCQCSLIKSGDIAVLVVVLSVSSAVKMETYADIYSDILKWLYSVFLTIKDSSKVEPTLTN